MKRWSFINSGHNGEHDEFLKRPDFVPWNELKNELSLWLHFSMRYF